jgi:hypothetical protein
MTQHLGTVAAILLLALSAIVALDPCARRDVEHAAGRVTRDLTTGFPGWIAAGFPHAEHGPGGLRPGPGPRKVGLVSAHDRRQV